MSKFEDRLWSELVCDYGPELARQGRAQSALRPRVRPRLLQAGLAAAAAAVAALIVAIVLATTTGSSPSQAYEVSQGADGSVTVSISELAGIAGANAQLKSLGVNIRVAAVEPGCTQTGQIAKVPPSAMADLAVLGKQGVTIQPRLIPPRATLLLSAKQIGQAIGLSYGVYRDPAPTCVKEGYSHAG